MKDVNGREIRTGDVVLIENAFFKNDNGLYFVARSPGDPSWSGSDYSLRRIRKNGALTTTNKISFWPLCVFLNDRFKRMEANRWNKEKATIKVVDGVCKNRIMEYFLEEAEAIKPVLHRLKWDFGEDHPEYVRNLAIQKHYQEMASRC